MRSFRITLALVMLFASLLWLLLGTSAPVYAIVSERAQIIPSAIQATFGATVVWIIATILFGRMWMKLPKFMKIKRYSENWKKYTVSITIQ